MYLILPRLRPGVRDLGPLSGLVTALQAKVELLLRAVTRKLRIPSILWLRPWWRWRWWCAKVFSCTLQIINKLIQVCFIQQGLISCFHLADVCGVLSTHGRFCILMSSSKLMPVIYSSYLHINAYRVQKGWGLHRWSRIDPCNWHNILSCSRYASGRGSVSYFVRTEPSTSWVSDTSSSSPRWVQIELSSRKFPWLIGGKIYVTGVTTSTKSRSSDNSDMCRLNSVKNTNFW